MKYYELEEKVKSWAADRKILTNGKIHSQAQKSLEEVGEVLEATAQLQIVDEFAGAFPELVGTHNFIKIKADAVGRLKDAYGDVLVTLIVGTAVGKIDLTECLELAYNEIKDRKGYLSPSGKFIKE